MTRYTQLTVRDAHMVTVLITRIKTGKICFESLVICIISVVRHFGVYRLIPKLYVSLFMLIKWLTIYSINVRRVSL